MVQSHFSPDDDRQQNSPQHGKVLPFIRPQAGASDRFKLFCIRFLLWLAREAKELVCGNYLDLLGGKAVVSSKLEKHAKATNDAIVISNIINIIGIAPFIYLSFASLGVAPAAALTLATNASLLKFGNISGTVAANDRPGQHSWSRSGQVSFAVLSAFLTVFSGVGTLIFNDYNRIRNFRAEELIAAKTESVNALQYAISPQLEKVRRDRAELEAKCRGVSPKDALWNSCEVRLRGSFSDRRTGFSQIDSASRPLEVREDELEAERLQAFKRANSEWQRRQEEGINSGSKLEFVKQQLPEVYRANFDPQGYLLDSGETVAIATTIFINDVKTLNWTRLGFAALFAGISIITSAGAVWMAIAFASRRDVVEDDPDAERLRDLAIERTIEEQEGDR